MSYRYPFTPFPKGWYRTPNSGNKIVAFGKQWRIDDEPLSPTCVAMDNPENTLPILLRNGYTYIFFDEACHPPYFDVPDIAEFHHPDWQPPFSLYWKVRVHAQEVAENALDLSHFCTVHTYHDIPVLSQFFRRDHQFNVVMHSRRKVMGFIAETTMDITYHGMGVVVANVNSSNGVTLKVLLTTTPIDQEYVVIQMEVAIKKTRDVIKNLLLKWILPNEVKKEFSLDIPVWEAKIYRSKPLLCQNEANIIRIRKWAMQFY